MESNQQQSGHSAGTASISGAQIRSRITVVCAECKRLKLKCDRRNPCSSCVKRDTTQRCAYSAAAAEKIDVQSLHNRLLLLESQLAQYTSGVPKPAQNSTLDRSLVAVSGGSSVFVSMDDIASLWLEQLEVPRDVELRPVEDPAVSERTTAYVFPDSSVFHTSDFDRPGVTPRLLGHLPAEDMRDQLFPHMQQIMRVHPCFNFNNFRSRTLNVFAQDAAPGSCTISFFALMSACFALGAQSWLEANRISTSAKPPREYNPSCLWMLSRHTIIVYEETQSNYDLDYLFSLILQVLFMLHDGKPRCSHLLFPTVAKMVNVARMMGLGVDPDDTPGKFSAFEAEMRRRAWWDVFYYDLFVSDFLGQVPLISDNSFTTNMPTEVDDDSFFPDSAQTPPPNDVATGSNNTYFIFKCRLAQLVKNTKKRIYIDAKQPGTNDGSMDNAIACEQDVKTWLNDLNPIFRLDVEGDSTLQSIEPHLIAQRCEIAMISQSLIINLFHPFLRKSYNRPAHHAYLATVNAAHRIVQAANIAQATLKGTRPAIFLSYSFNRQLFHTAVICANAVIQDPSSVYANVALQDLQSVMAIMRDPAIPSGRGPMNDNGVEGSISEQLKIVELLKQKADSSVRGGGSYSAGSKRKHSEVEESLQPGFQIPFTGSAVVTVQPKAMSPPSGIQSASTSQASSTRLRYSASEPARNGTWNDAASGSSSLRIGSTTHRGERHSKQHYPQVGIRNRANTAAKGRDSQPRSAHAGPAPQLPHSSQSPQAQTTPNPNPGPFVNVPSHPPPATSNGAEVMDTQNYAHPFDDSRMPPQYPGAFPGTSPPQSHPHAQMFDASVIPTPPTPYYPYPPGTATPQPYEASMGAPPYPMQMMMGMPGTPMDTAPHAHTTQHSMPPTPGDRHFPSIPEKSHHKYGPTAPDDSSGHESSDSGAFVRNGVPPPAPQVQVPSHGQWPGPGPSAGAHDGDPRYARWTTYDYQQWKEPT